MAISIKTDSGIEIYETRIHEIFADYEAGLVDEFTTPEDARKDMFKPAVFRGALKQVYIKLFKITKRDVHYNNKNCRLDYDNIDLLNDLWDIYTELCGIYKQSPTILNFGILTGIAKETFATWEKGEYRANGQGASSAHSRAVKKWRADCEAAAYDIALSGNPGGMFILKANYGYQEAAQRVEVVGAGRPEETAAQIMQKHSVAAQLAPPDEPEE